MRLSRLLLLRFGHFTDREIEFPPGEHDYHLIYGANEAGKSTARAAIENLLFGIAQNSPYNFLHDYKDLRIGAVVEQGDETLAFYRRKGRKDTVLDERGIPLADGRLETMLAGATEAFFVRMFSLDQKRLEQGGGALLAAEGEVGQSLFAASAGLATLRRTLQALEAESDRLWAPRRSQTRRYYAADEQRKAAVEELKQATVSAAAWRKLRREHERQAQQQQALQKELRDANTRMRRVQRMRRILPHLSELRHLQESLRDCGEVPTLPEDAGRLLQSAEQQNTTLVVQIEELEAQLAQMREANAKIIVDERILQHADEIEAMGEQYTWIDRVRSRIPQVEAQLEAVGGRMRSLCTELGWDIADPAQARYRCPSRLLRDQLRAILQERELLQRDIEQAQKSLTEGQHAEAQSLDELQRLGPSHNTADLNRAVCEARCHGQAQRQLAELEAEWAELQAQIAQGLSQLEGWNAGADALGTLALPTESRIRAGAEALDRAAEICSQCQSEADRLSTELEELRLSREQIVRDKKAIGPEMITAQRQNRDGLWQAIRGRWLQDDGSGYAGLTDTELAQNYEESIAETDELVDQRFDRAQAAAQLLRTEQDIERHEAALRRTSQTLAEASQAEKETRMAWSRLWTSAGIEAGTPTDMVHWVAHYERLVGQHRQAERLGKKHQTLEQALQDHQRDLTAALAGIGAEVPPDSSFDALLAQGEESLTKLTALEGRRQEIDKQLSQARQRITATEKALQEAQLSFSAWQERLQDSLQACGLPQAIGVAAAAGALETLEMLASAIAEREQLHTELQSQLRATIEAFESRIQALFCTLQRETGDADPLRSLRPLIGDLKEQRKRRTQCEQQQAQIRSLETKLQQARERCRETEATIAHLCDQAGAADLAELRRTILLAAQANELEGRIEQRIGQILEAGDGKTLAELEAETQSVEADALAAQAEEIQQQIDQLTAQIGDQAARLRDAESALCAVTGDEQAAIAENKRQLALSEMTEAVGQFARKRSAALLLRWALERYRREKQGPLLVRASDIFKKLTLARFSGLQVDFDEHDQPELLGMRPGGERVRVPGMSQGTADQLYLALRLAALEEYLKRAPALPFIADDLFVNFDDARAKAGLEVLSELSLHTQVIVLTHHAHLVDLAQSTANRAPCIIRL